MALGTHFKRIEGEIHWAEQEAFDETIDILHSCGCDISAPKEELDIGDNALLIDLCPHTAYGKKARCKQFISRDHVATNRRQQLTFNP